MSLTPTTPVSSPLQAPPPWRLPSAWAPQSPITRLRRFWLERLDRAGQATVMAYLVSALSTTVALGFSLGAFPFDTGIWNVAAWMFHHFSNPLWALPIALGFASERQLPRLIAWYSIYLAVAYACWDWLPLTQGASTPIKLLYIAGALAAAGLSLFKRLRGTDAA